MMEAVVLAAVAGMIGVAARAALEGEQPPFFPYHYLFIGLVSAIIALFFYNDIFAASITDVKSVFDLVLFLMYGYIGSDLLDTFITLATVKSVHRKGNYESRRGKR